MPMKEDDPLASVLADLPEADRAAIAAIGDDEPTQAAADQAAEAGTQGGDAEDEIVIDAAGNADAEGQGQAAASPAAAPPADTAQPTAKTEPQGQDDAAKLKANLRASRRAEHRLAEENRRLQQQLEEARKAAPKTPNEIEQAEQTLAELRADFGEDSPVVKNMAAVIERAKAAAPAPSNEPAHAEFVPPSVHPDLQDILDDLPLAESWRTDPVNREAWDKLVEVDGVLADSPKWRGVDNASRLAEAQRLTAQILGIDPGAAPKNEAPAPTAPAPAATPAAPAAAPSARPSLSDFAGAAPVSNEFERLPDAQMMDKAMSMSARDLERLVGL